ncbi:phage tail protein [Serratia proteamaculans]|uniref:Phage tail protein n=1 Tax=Serratia proteamaculans TaxID=28151 RepID=A0ABS0U1M1_SERPR|nr:phage tail protein [Serratia proteamaculans]MBI6183461.1 phage tail protein [Serratia proteamaculans]
MPVIQEGDMNTTALSVPDVYVQIVPPSENYINGVPTNILGIVGTASWGPVNAPVTIGDLTACVQAFGNIKARKHDLGTAVWASVLNGANDFRCVRVTDGTDVAATELIETNCLTLTAKHTGSTGNSISVAIAAGSRPGTWRLTVSLPGLLPEVYDNLGKGLTGNALWGAIAETINSGTGPMRGASGLVVATAGAGTAAPTAGTTVLKGGTDGATGVSGTTLLGVDVTPRKGMYALRGTGVKTAFLVDCDDSATWIDQVAFALDEGVYLFGVGPSGETITDAIGAKNTAGIDSYGFKLLLGDWCLFNDTINGVKRFISPQGFLAGRRAALSPEQSTLNKPLYGIIATQKSAQSMQYSYAELQQLAEAGIDVITNPIPAGNQFGGRIGCNTASNPMINGDNYTALTNYIAYTLDKGMGIYIGRLQSPAQRSQARSTVSSFLANMQQQGMIGDVNNPTKDAFTVKLDNSNNPKERVALGYEQIDVRVTYLSIITKLLINVEGGQSVNVNVVSSSAS